MVGRVSYSGQVMEPQDRLSVLSLPYDRVIPYGVIHSYLVPDQT